MNNIIKQITDEYMNKLYDSKEGIIENMLNRCTIETRNLKGEKLKLDDIKRQMQIIGCRITIEEQDSIETITLWINSWKEEQYKIIKNYNDLSFEITKTI